MTTALKTLIAAAAISAMASGAAFAQTDPTPTVGDTNNDGDIEVQATQGGMANTPTADGMGTSYELGADVEVMGADGNPVMFRSGERVYIMREGDMTGSMSGSGAGSAGADTTPTSGDTNSDGDMEVTPAQ